MLTWSLSLCLICFSGMTHSWGRSPRWHASGQHSWWTQYRKFLVRNFMILVHAVYPWTDLLHSDSGSSKFLHETGGGENSKQGLQFSLEKNFGELEFDWDKSVVTMRALGEDRNGPPLLMASYTFDQLSGRSPMPAFGKSSGSSTTWECINYRGTASSAQIITAHTLTILSMILFAAISAVMPAILIRLATPRPSRSSPKTM